MTTTTTADADPDVDAPRQLQQQQQLPQQQWRNGKRWGVSTSKDVCGTDSIIPATDERGRDPGGAAFLPLLPPFPPA
jgi:hypothetical protein